MKLFEQNQHRKPFVYEVRDNLHSHQSELVKLIDSNSEEYLVITEIKYFIIFFVLNLNNQYYLPYFHGAYRKEHLIVLRHRLIFVLFAIKKLKNY